ncbi:MAG: DUF1501 domain-containing protein [Cyclobacteriaceae bacterium]
MCTNHGKQSRREFIYGLGTGLGSVALGSLLGCESGSTVETIARKVAKIPTSPLAIKPAMMVAKAKSCIFLMMEGGPSHIDTFDPKPTLEKFHLKKFKREGENFSAMSSGNRYIVQSPFKSRKVGQSGADMCEHFVHMADIADDLCFYRGCQAESVNHPTAQYHMNTGNRFGGDPAIGSWVVYGLGSMNENIPTFVVLPEVAYPQGGAANWSNGFLPAHFQGTPLRPHGSPVLNLEPAPGLSRYHQRESLDLLNTLNQDHQKKHPEHDELAARIANYELAFRMQMEFPELMDIDSETDECKELYGIGDPETDAFGRKCLLARKMIEKGVVYVQLFSGGWDSHDFLGRAHSNLIRSVDKPIAGLIKDLKRRGLLDETLVVWTGEFGRSPDNGLREGGVAYGRDHNNTAMNMWFAGGGVKAGHTIGNTDEIGEKAVEVVHPIRDVHITMLKLLGLDDNKLTYFHGGRYKQLSQFGGKVINELIG